jgi:opine dehydrogenase
VEVAVLGAGNGGCAVAFDWAQHGHNVRLFATAEYPGEVPAIAERGEILSTGALSGVAPISYAGHDAGRTVSGADLIMVVGPAYATLAAKIPSVSPPDIGKCYESPSDAS